LGQNAGPLHAACQRALRPCPVDFDLLKHRFPHVRLAFVLWAADEDFPAEANVLFSRSTAGCLTAEDAAVLADVALRGVLKADDGGAAETGSPDDDG